MANVTWGYDELTPFAQKTHANWAAAFSAANQEDNLQGYCPATARGLRCSETMNVSAKPCSIEMMVDGVFFSARTAVQVYCVADFNALGVSSEIVIKNVRQIIASNAATAYAPFTGDDTTDNGIGILFENCYCHGGSRAFRAAGPDVEFRNCMSVGCYSNAFNFEGAASANDCTAIGAGQAGFDVNGNACTLQNCLSYGSVTADFLAIASATGNNNCSHDATAADGNWNAGTDNISSQTTATIGFLRDKDQIGNVMDFRLASDTGLAGLGLHIAAITTDIDGITRANPPAIGASEGTFYASVTAPTFGGITALTNNGDGTITAEWADATVGTIASFEVSIHTSSMSAANLNAQTYVCKCVDDDGSATFSCIIGTTAGGAALLTSGTLYYVAVRAISTDGVSDTGDTNLSATATGGINAGAPGVTLDDTTPVQLLTTATTIYECPAGKQATLITLYLCNTDSSARTVTIHKQVSGDAIADDNAFLKTYSLDAAGGIGHIYNDKIYLTLDAGTKIVGLASAAAHVTAMVGVVEIAP